MDALRKVLSAIIAVPLALIFRGCAVSRQERYAKSYGSGIEPAK